MLTDIKMQFSERNIAVLEQVPRTELAEVRTKVKNFNKVTKERCSEIDMKLVLNLETC